MEIKAVVFDFGGTLFDYYPSNAEIWVNICKRQGKHIRPDNKNLIRGLKNQEIYHEKSALDKNDELSKADFEDPFDPILRKWNNFVIQELRLHDKNIHDVVREEFKKREGDYKIFDETTPLLKELSNRGVRMGIVSNTSPISAEKRRPILKEHNIIHYFEFLLFSSEIGYSKPSPWIFNLALKSLNLPAENVIYVGDSIYFDVNGAKDVGMIPVLFDPLQSSSYKGFKLTNLLELIPIITQGS